MSAEPEWVLLSEFGSGLEADLVAGALEAEGVLMIRTRPEAGIFGGGYDGPSIKGIRIFVARRDLDRAKDIAEAFGDDEPAE